MASLCNCCAEPHDHGEPFPRQRCQARTHDACTRESGGTSSPPALPQVQTVVRTRGFAFTRDAGTQLQHFHVIFPTRPVHLIVSSIAQRGSSVLARLAMSHSGSSETQEMRCERG